MVIKQAIGVFDSGIGGLTVVRQLVRLLPNENVIYLGDTARVPYGNKSPETVRQYARQSTNFLLSHDVKLIIVACNTVSAVALDSVEQMSNVPVIGMISPGANGALKSSKNGRIGIIGTRATIQSQAYELELKKQSADREIWKITQACPLFVPIAEEGWHKHPATRLIAEEYLSPLKHAGIDTLILGCTHYPMLYGMISTIMPEVALIDSGKESAIVAKDILTKNSLESNEQDNLSQLKCFVTDKPTNFSQVAERFLGFQIPDIQQISIDELHQHEV